MAPQLAPWPDLVFYSGRPESGFQERMRIHNGGNISVTTGNLLIGTAGKGIDYNGGPKDLFGTGTPEGSITAAIGSTYRRADGGASTSFYIKESGTGNTGWRAV